MTKKNWFEIEYTPKEKSDKNNVISHLRDTCFIENDTTFREDKDEIEKNLGDMMNYIDKELNFKIVSEIVEFIDSIKTFKVNHKIKDKQTEKHLNNIEDRAKSHLIDNLNKTSKDLQIKRLSKALETIGDVELISFF